MAGVAMTEKAGVIGGGAATVVAVAVTVAPGMGAVDTVVAGTIAALEMA